MKMQFKNILCRALPIVFFMVFSTTLLAQDPPPPQPPTSHGNAGNVPGGGAPIGEGIFILSLLGAGYGGKKWQKSKQTH